MSHRGHQVVWFAAVFMGWATVASAQPRWSIEFENGPAFAGYNDVRIPGDTGTLFSLTDELKSDPAYSWRVRVSYRAAPRHVLSALVAPLGLNASGTVDRPITFLGGVFPAGVPLTARYEFNSYRLTYRYELVQRPTWKFGLGFAAKVRDAITRLGGGGQSATKTNVGFVPLVNFKLERSFNDRVGLLLEGDALGARQGRAEDILAAVQIGLNRRASLTVGYRLLEGGADVAEVYTFTLVHYLAIGASIRF